MAVIDMDAEKVKRILREAINIHVDEMLVYHRSEKNEADLQRFKASQHGVLSLMVNGEVVIEKIVKRERAK